MIIDATDTIMGRLAAFAAKKSLQGEKIEIINSEKALIRGNKQQVVERFKHMRKRGGPLHGPYIPRMPHMLLKRVIRGMLPHKKERGRLALKRIKCHIGVPEELKGKKAEALKSASVTKLQTAKYFTLGELSKQLGAKLR